MHHVDKLDLSSQGTLKDTLSASFHILIHILCYVYILMNKNEYEYA